jgi:hypothetical protein
VQAERLEGPPLEHLLQFLRPHPVRAPQSGYQPTTLYPAST